MRDEFVNTLKAQNGYHEGQDPDGTWNNIQKFSEQTPGFAWSDGQPWCATFESWGAFQQGMTDIWPMTASCSTAVDYWQSRSRWSEYPVLGGPFYLGPGGSEHTGVVYAYDGDTIYTVEGNTNDNGSANGDGVYLKQRPRRGPGSPYGYGVPAYPEGTISADPGLGGVASASVGSATNQGSSGNYTVQSGDTLSGIAANHGISLQDLLNANPGYASHPDSIGVGDKLMVPTATSTPSQPAQSSAPPFQHDLVYNDGQWLQYDSAAAVWQDHMQNVRGWHINGVDGLYGPHCREICREFQERHGLEVDGIVGPITWRATWDA